MIALNAHYDGKVLVPDEPLALPTNQKVRIELEPIESSTLAEPNRKIEFGLQKDLVVYLAPDWKDPLPDDIWDHNKDDENAQP
jgi:hypothetical protein